MLTPNRPGSSPLERLRFIGDIGGLTTPQCIVLYDLFAHANGDGFAWPSRKTIARRCRFGNPESPRTATVSDAMAALAEVKVAGEPLIERCAQRGRANQVRLRSWLRSSGATGEERGGYATRTEQDTSGVPTPHTPSVPPSEDRPEKEGGRSILPIRQERTPSGVRTSSRSPSPSATVVTGGIRDCDWSLDYPSPFRRGEAFDLDKALAAAADFLDGDPEVFAPRERVIEVLEMLIDETGDPFSWGWFAKPSGEGLCRIDRVKDYLASGNLMEVV